MPPKKDTKAKTTKQPSKPKAPSGGSGAGKNKWSKGRSKDKLNNKVVFDGETYDRLLKEFRSYKLVTPSVISDKLKVNGTLARLAIKELLEKGIIKKVDHHSAQQIYTRAAVDVEEPQVVEEKKGGKKGKN